ncbi:MAG: thymidine phosphorylase [archaeon]
MKLKFKPLNLESGRPIAFINEFSAEKLNVAEGSRIEVIHKKTKLTLAVNLTEKLLKENEISFSKEAIAFLKIKKGTLVEISPALEPVSSHLILKKLNDKELSKEEIYSIIKAISNNSLNEAEIAYFVSAVYHHGMTMKETKYLTEAMVKTGNTISWNKRKIADKHSIGGIAGNRTTPIIVAICAAAGITMPKTSSRAITSAAGTADTLETITEVVLEEKQLKQIVKKNNACLAWGGALGLAPADDKMIRVERLLNVDPESQLIASILSKKISIGSTHVLIDIPYGPGAKVSLKKAHKLKKEFLQVGRHFKLKIDVILTQGREPIGNGIGPILEMRDILKVLKRKDSPKDLEQKSVLMAGEIIEMMGKAKKGKGKALAQQILDSKKALKKFEQIITAQGKKKTKLLPAKLKHQIKSKSNTKVKLINNKSINILARILGSPSTPTSGLYLYKHISDKVKKGETILTLYSESPKKLKQGINFFKKNKPITLG